jgi:hypothetical protein
LFEKSAFEDACAMALKAYELNSQIHSTLNDNKDSETQNLTPIKTENTNLNRIVGCLDIVSLCTLESILCTSYGRLGNGLNANKFGLSALRRLGFEWPQTDEDAEEMTVTILKRLDCYGTDDQIYLHPFELWKAACLFVFRYYFFVVVNNPSTCILMWYLIFSAGVCIVSYRIGFYCAFWFVLLY